MVSVLLASCVKSRGERCFNSAERKCDLALRECCERCETISAGVNELGASLLRYRVHQEGAVLAFCFGPELRTDVEGGDGEVAVVM